MSVADTLLKQMGLTKIFGGVVFLYIREVAEVSSAGFFSTMF